jgi:predicted ABC-type ATPase
LSGHYHLGLLERARTAGYQINLVYVGTGDVEINLERVRNRVARGGHDIPENDVRRRYTRSLARAQLVASVADYAIVLDNSGTEMVPIIERSGDAVKVYREIPSWAQSIADAMQR